MILGGRGEKREGNETPEREMRNKKIRRMPTLQRETTPQRRKTPTRRKTLQKKKTSGGNEKDTTGKKGRVFLFEGKEYNTYSTMVEARREHYKVWLVILDCYRRHSI